MSPHASCHRGIVHCCVHILWRLVLAYLGVSVSKFTVLSAESLNPEHPLHDEFTARMDDIWENYSQYPWLIPPQLGSWKSSMRPVVRKAMEIMDGVQLWWLREPEVDLCKEWAQMENMLFPSPLWDAYR